LRRERNPAAAIRSSIRSIDSEAGGCVAACTTVSGRAPTGAAFESQDWPAGM
jgi:hypothetical protein